MQILSDYDYFLSKLKCRLHVIEILLFAPIKHFSVTEHLLFTSCYTFLKFFFALYKCELITKYSASLYNLSLKKSKYASDIDHAVTFSSEEGKQYQIK